MKRFLVRFCAIVVLVATMSVLPSGHAARAYFTDQPAGGSGLIISVALDGTSQQTVAAVSNTSDVRGIAFHRSSGRIYFLDNGASKKIYSVLPDGSDQQEIAPLTAGSFNADLEIDELSSKVYWAENSAGLIRRADLNGGNVQTAVSTTIGVATAPYFIFVNPADGHVYWGVTSSGSGPSSFRRAPLTNGIIDPSFVITSSTRTRDIGIDPRTGTAYWCDRQTGAIFKRLVSGGIIQVVIAGMNAPHGIALDLEAEKIYWADTGARDSGPFNTSARRIARCNFDGTGFETISTPAVNSEPWDLALDLRSPTYAEWRTRFFSAGATDAGTEDDADEDDAPNLLEYALGTNPRKSSSVPLIASQGTGLNYTRRRDTDLVFTVEVSTNLNFNVWHHNGDGSGLLWTSEMPPVPKDADFEIVVVAPGPALSGVASAFFRVRVSDGNSL